MKSWLVLDTHYLCHRAFHTTLNLSWKERPTGVIFSFLKSIAFLKDEFQTDHVVFCFEHPKLFRKIDFPEYKIHRNQPKRDRHEVKAHGELCSQIDLLRDVYLPQIGFKNIFCVEGYESDDVMAAIASCASHRDEVILVTADTDLYQCLDDHVMMYSPAKRAVITKTKFIREYGILPHQWAVLKAITGCATDEVPGIKGIGQTTALRYLRQELKPDSKQYKLIHSAESKAIVRRNKRLVKLPYEGCQAPALVEDKISRQGWLDVCAKLGMKSIAQHPPVSTKKLLRRELY